MRKEENNVDGSGYEVFSIDWSLNRSLPDYTDAKKGKIWKAMDLCC
jgi:hypothetical protein